MIVTVNKALAPLHDVKLFGLRSREATEYYEFAFKYDEGVVKSFNTQFRLVLDQDHPGFHQLVKQGVAMDPTRFANKRAKELQEVSQSGQVGDFVQPTFWAIVPDGVEVEPDYTEIARRVDEVLQNHSVVDAMRSPVSGTLSLHDSGVDSVITVNCEGGVVRKFTVPIPASEIVVQNEVYVTEPLFAFAPTAGKAARRWVTNKISQDAKQEINGQEAYDIDLLKAVPSGSFLWFDARKSDRFFSMPARWSSRHIRFEVRSPHRTSALSAAGISAPALV